MVYKMNKKLQTQVLIANRSYDHFREIIFVIVSRPFSNTPVAFENGQNLIMRF